MRLGLAVVALALAGVVASCSRGGHQQGGATFAPPPRGTVLGVVWQENDSTLLRRFSRTSLAPSSQAVKLGHNGGAWSFSPDESLVALAGAAPLEIRIVDIGGMRLDQVLPLPRDFARPPEEPAVTSLAWPAERRILALVEWGAWDHALVVIDPFERRIISREAIEGTLVALARTHDGLALLLAPIGRIGPARLLLVDSSGDQRSIALADVPAGLETVDPQGSAQRLAIPALAVDPAGTRALVVPAAGPVAEVDLVSGRVVYHDVHEPVSLVGRLRNWLEPSAEAKTAEGPEREAVWVGEHLVAVFGQDTHQTAKGDEQTTPAGLALIDVRRWTKRILDEHASQSSFSAGTLLAYGTTWTDATHERGMGLTGYGLDGRERFHLFENEPIYFLETAGPYAYVWRGRQSPVAVDLRSGKVSNELDRYRGNDLPSLVVPGAQLAD
jgi:hypothetical protein